MPKKSKKKLASKEVDPDLKGFHVLRYKSGDRFEGYLNEDGNRHSYGAYFWAHGEVYTGEWRDGLMSGKGKLKYKNGDTFQGEFVEGYISGVGLRTTNNGAMKEKGYYDADGESIGPVTRRMISGDSFSGTIQNGMRQGYGEHFWQDGYSFKGYWKCDEMDGMGIWGPQDGMGNGEGERRNLGNMDTTCTNVVSPMYCLHHQGTYKNSFREGYGVGIIRRDKNVGFLGYEIWELERRYEGHWMRGYYSGHGKLHYQSFVSEPPLSRRYRVTYSGEFHEGMRAGTGALIQEQVHDGDDNYDAPDDIERPLDWCIRVECSNANVANSLQTACDIDDLSRYLEGFHLVGEFLCGACVAGVITSTVNKQCYVKFQLQADDQTLDLNTPKWMILQVGRHSGVSTTS